MSDRGRYSPLHPTARRSWQGAGRVDGRRLRSERTRRLIVEAYLALLRENAQMPTAAQIAERAGYSVRSVFERFPDLPRCASPSPTTRSPQARAHAAVRDLDAPIARRASGRRSRQRAQTCERWLPLWRVLLEADARVRNR